MLTHSQCANDNGTAPEAWAKIAQWDEIFLKDAVKRLNKQISGHELSTRDVKDFVRLPNMEMAKRC